MNVPLPPIIPRSELLKILAKHAKQAQEHQRLLGLLLCDIRSFGHINTQHGFNIGDMIINEIFERLEQMVRSTDGLNRTGANEFALVLPFLENPVIAQLVAVKALKLLEKNGFGDNWDIHCKPALGIALIDPEQLLPDKLCLLAESALKQAKSTNKPFVILHDQQQLIENDLETSLKNALKNSDFELFFQPKVNLHNKHAIQSEALIRWQSSKDKLVAPSLFIPASEQFGLIQPLTRWVIQNTLRIMSNAPKHLSHYGVSINISSSYLDMYDLSRLIEDSLKLWSVDPSRLTLEITESVFMEKLETTMAAFADMRDKLGIRISIDDFGTGYSSLEYFKHLPADELKIDKSFIAGIKDNAADLKIVELMVQLAKNFDLEIVAEGVEDKETFNMVKQLGCDYVQGYYCSKPLPINDYITWIENYQQSNLRRVSQ